MAAGQSNEDFMAELTFYTNPMSRGRIARWMIEETGVAYDTEILDYGPSMKSEAYRRINPMGKVPAIRHGDTVVTECAAICAYLADAFPEAGLAPDTRARGSYYRWMFFAAGPLEQAVTNRSMGFQTPPDRQAMVGFGRYEDVMDALESAVTAQPYITGERFSAADVYVGSHIGWGLRFKTIEERPAFVAYWDRLKNRPAALAATAKDDAALAAMKKD